MTEDEFINSMTDKDKLLALIKVAKLNHWVDLYHSYERVAQQGNVLSDTLEVRWCDENTNYQIISYSINDMLFNFKKGEKTFIDALCLVPRIRSKYDLSPHYPDKQNFINQWLNTETSERLKVLFKTFSHLLDYESYLKYLNNEE